MDAPENRLQRALNWIEFADLKLGQISQAQILKREDWVTRAGATYPRLNKDSIFITRIWDDGSLTKEEKRILIRQRRRIMLESQ